MMLLVQTVEFGERMYVEEFKCFLKNCNCGETPFPEPLKIIFSSSLIKMVLPGGQNWFF